MITAEWCLREARVCRETSLAFSGADKRARFGDGYERTAAALTIAARVLDAGAVGGLALLLSEHFGTRPILAMARDRSDLRSKIRDGGGYDINEPTIDDLEEAARAILAYLKGEVE